jgi:hypothetical protein
MARLRGCLLVALLLAVGTEAFGAPPDVIGPVFQLRTPSSGAYIGIASAAGSGVFGSAIGDLYLRSYQKLLISTNDGLTAALTIDASGNVTATGSISSPSFLGNASTATEFTAPLSGDVTGSQSATVVSSVGGATAGSVASAVTAVNGATFAAIADTLVRRDFTGGAILSALRFDDGSVQTSAFPQKTQEQIATLHWYDVNKSFDDIPVGLGPIGMVFDGDNIWAVNNTGNTVTKIDGRSGSAINSYVVGSSPFAAAFDGTSIWVTNFLSSTVTKLKKSDGSFVNNYAVGTNPRGIAFDGTYIWTANFGSSSVTRLLAKDGSAAGTFSTGAGTTPYGIAFDGQKIWVTNSAGSNVVLLDASTGALITPFDTVATVAPAAAPRHVVFDGKYIWVSNFNRNTIRKFKAADGSSVDYTLPVINGEGMVFDGTSIWIACYTANVLLKLRAGDGTVIANIALPSGAQQRYLAFDGRNVWAQNFAANSVSRY